MSDFSCCNRSSAHSKLPVQRFTTIASVILSSTALLLMPKCPVCVAAYVALLTGISLSTANAGHLRTALIVVCLSVLASITLLVLGRIQRWKGGGKRQRV